jgi:hypothetical protein
MDNLKAVNPRRAFVRTLRKLLGRRLLASKIDLFHEPALIHEMNGIPRHSEVYKLLYLEALGHARAFAEIWGVPVAELHARIPSLEHLRVLAGSNELFEGTVPVP